MRREKVKQSFHAKSKCKKQVNLSAVRPGIPSGPMHYKQIDIDRDLICKTVHVSFFSLS